LRHLIHGLFQMGHQNVPNISFTFEKKFLFLSHHINFEYLSYLAYVTTVTL
jgi:hypothetical protein